MACQHLQPCERPKAINVLKAYVHLLKPSVQAAHAANTLGNSSINDDDVMARATASADLHHPTSSLHQHAHSPPPDLLEPASCHLFGIDGLSDLLPPAHSEPPSRAQSATPHASDMSSLLAFRTDSNSNSRAAPAAFGGGSGGGRSWSPPVACDTCNVAEQHMTFICLDCVHITCLHHYADHMHQSGHSFFLAPDHRQLFCASCADFTYSDIVAHAIEVATLYLAKDVPYNLCDDTVLQTCSRYNSDGCGLLPCPHTWGHHRPCSSSSHDSKDGLRVFCTTSNADSGAGSDTSASLHHHHHHHHHHQHQQHRADEYEAPVNLDGSTPFADAAAITRADNAHSTTNSNSRRHNPYSQHHQHHHQHHQHHQQEASSVPPPPPPPPSSSLQHHRGQHKREQWRNTSVSPASLSSGSPKSYTPPPPPQANTILSSHSHFGLGLRGLSNLGQTCFINVILQACAHNPLLRNYFLAQTHTMSEACVIHSSLGNNSRFSEGDCVEVRFGEAMWCRAVITRVQSAHVYDVQFTDDSEEMTHVPRVCIRSPGDHTAPNTCLACLLSDFFSEMYTGNRQQLAPTNMLYAVWKHLRQLAGYAQHDCHEFFIALLDRLHRHLRPPDEPMHLLSKQPSVVRSVFTGLMQSDVICRRCDNVSSTHEPFYDISLGIRPSTHDSPTSLVSLRGCLARYTSPEDLGSDARVFCPRCQARQLAQKRLMIAQPPKTLTFHLKRFEHIPRLQKITTFVEFPTSIDMRPYLVQSGGGAHTAAMAHSAHAPIMYSLYCVVVHIGKIESGHYICYIRLNHPHEQWVCCDDDTLTPVTAAEVLSKPAYMLLYMKDEL